MAEKFELPNAQIYRLVKEGAQETLTSNQTNSVTTAETGGVIVSKDTRKAFQQLAGFFVLYLSST